jgi:hypothetical protein
MALTQRLHFVDPRMSMSSSHDMDDEQTSLAVERGFGTDGDDRLSWCPTIGSRATRETAAAIGSG